MDADYVDDIALLANTPTQANSLLPSLENLPPNEHKVEYMCFTQDGAISTPNGSSLNLVDKLKYFNSSVSSTEKVVSMSLEKAWTSIERLSIIWKTDLSDKIKRIFFQGAVVSLSPYECSTWVLKNSVRKARW